MARSVTIFGTRVPVDQITQVTYDRDGVQVTLSGSKSKGSPIITGFSRPAPDKGISHGLDSDGPVAQASR